MTDLDAIRRRCDAATSGPWNRDTYYIVGPIPGGRPGGEVIADCRPVIARYRDAPWVYTNAAFIAHAREDIPALLAVIDGLAKALEECAAPIPGFMGKSSDDILTAVLVEFRRRTEQARAQLAAIQVADAGAQSMKAALDELAGLEAENRTLRNLCVTHDAEIAVMTKQIETHQKRRLDIGDALDAGQTPHLCPVCQGRGQVQFNPAMPFGDGASCGPWPCKPCNASGIVWNVWANSRPHPMTPAPAAERPDGAGKEE